MTPFDLADESCWQRWRDARLANSPTRIEDIVVEVANPKSPTAAEHDKVLQCIRRANMAIYVTPCREDDREIPRLFGQAFGLQRLDRHWLAADDGLSALTVAESGSTPREFIPYTDRPIKWHTDGYYNTPERQILGLQLYCVQSAAQGGENQLLDHEIAWLHLRERNIEYVRALMAPDAMTIPARTDEDGEARPAQSGAVFSVLPDGALHMRYTARTRSIEWKDTPVVREAVAALEQVIEKDSAAQVLKGRLEPGMGLISNNVLHDRSGFVDGPGKKRRIYRARYYDRIAA